MTPISIRRAFDADLDRTLHDLHAEDEEAAQMPSGAMGVLVPVLFVVVPWLVWMWV